MDKIELKGMAFYGYHGVRPEEQTLGQRFVVDLEVESDLKEAGTTDDLTKTIDYTRLFAIVKEVVEGPAYKLIESVAEEIAQKVLTGFKVQSVRVKIMKPEVPIQNSVLKHTSVEIYRKAEG